MEPIKKKKISRIPVYRIILYLLIITSVVGGVTLSRYSTTLMGADSGRVSKFAYEVTITDPESSPQADLDVLIRATAKLSDAENCMFDNDDVSVVRKIQVTNKSEVAVNATIASVTQQMSEGVVWCLLLEDDYAGSRPDHDDIIDKVYNGGPVPGSFSTLEADLQTANQATIDSWNNDDEGYLQIASGNSCNLTLVFWAEYDGVYENEPDFKDDFDTVPYIEDNFELVFNVTQAD